MAYLSSTSLTTLVVVMTLFYCTSAKFIAPTQIHLALTGDPTEMVVSWLTTVSTEESTVIVLDSFDEQVFSTQPYNTNQNQASPQSSLVFHGTQSSYLNSTGYIHHVILTNLKPNTTYYYFAGSINGWSEQYTFQTAPPPMNATSTFPITQWITYGDMGATESRDTVKRVTARVRNGQARFIHQCGDYGYGDDRTASQYETCWNAFFDQMQGAMPFVPYMSTVGNHETACNHKQCDTYAKNFTAFNMRFRMPSAESGGAKNMWFSWNYANVHFVSISTETDYPGCPTEGDGYNFGDQLGWLERDLQAASQNPTINWIIAAGHRPMYCSYNGDGLGEVNGTMTGFSQTLLQSFEDLFYKYKVDVYMDGHIHAYERMLPIYKSQVCGQVSKNVYTNPGCTTYVVAGAAGNQEGHANSGWDPNPPVWSAFRNWEDYGYAIVTTVGNQTLHYEWRRDTDDMVMDWFRIEKTTRI